MLRIRLIAELEEVTLKLEGSLVGVSAWRSTRSVLAGHTPVLDMKAVDRVNQAGVYLLALLRQRGVQLVTSGTSMTELVRTLEKEWPRRSRR